MLTQEQRQKLRNAGYSEVKINAFEAKKAIKQVESQPQEPTFAGRVIRETVKPLAKLATNVVNTGQAIAGKEITEPFSGDYLGKVERVGKDFDITKGFTPENITALKDAVKSGVDIGVLLGGGAGTGSIAKTGIKEGIKQGVIQGAKTGSIVGGISGAGTGLEEGATVGSTLANTAMGTLGGGLIGGAVGGVTGLAPSGETLVKAGGQLKRGGEGLYSTTIKTEKPTAIALQKYQASQPSLSSRIAKFISGKEIPVSGETYKPITEANTAVRRGLVGTEWQIGKQAKQVSDSLFKDVISPKLKESGKKISMKTFLAETRKDIIDSTTDLSRRKELLNALNKISSDYKKVGTIGLEKLQGYKSGWAEKVPESSYAGKVITGALNEVRSRLAKKARTTIYDSLGGDIKTAYLDWGNLQSIMKSGIESMDKLDSKSWSRQLWEAIVDKAVTPVTTIGGQVLYRTGEGLEFVGSRGAKKVGDIIGQNLAPIKTQRAMKPKNISKNVPMK